jgi:competence protein ComEC
MIGKHPFVGITLAMIVGIRLSYELIESHFIYLFLIILIFTYLLNWYLKIKAAYLLIAFFLLGLLAGSQQIKKRDIGKLSIERDEVLVGVILETKEKNQSQRVLFRAKQVNDRLIKPTNILLTIRDSIWELKPGDHISLHSGVFQPYGATDPGAFNYKIFLARKGIHHIAYPKVPDIQMIPVKRWINLSLISHQLRQWLSERIKQVFISERSSSIILGALLGQTNEIESERVDLYRSAGIGYFFAVSGLHVGMIFLLFSPLLYFKSWHPILRIIIPFLSLFGTWLFVAAAGFTPSAVRAAAMISMYVLAGVLHRKCDKWNVLGLIAFISLLFDPSLIFDIGFQFSYLALSGIFLFYPILIKLPIQKPAIFKRIWNLIALSISAQVFLLPLSVFYFGTFSPLFWLNSLIAFVFLQFSLYLAILKLMLPLDIPFLHHILEQCIDFLLGTLDWCIELICNLSFSVVNFKPDLITLIGLYLLIIFFTIRIFNTSVRLTRLVFAISVLFLATSIGLKYLNYSDTSLVVSSNKERTIYLETRDARFPLMDKDLLHAVCIASARTDKDPKELLIRIVTEDKKPTLQYSDILILDSKKIPAPISKYAAYTGCIIATSSMYNSELKKLERWCALNDIPFYPAKNNYIQLKI